MMNTRRKFLQTGGLLAAGALIGNNKLFAEPTSHRLKKFGIQLYGLRGVLGDDPKAVLKQVADMGYKYIEPFDHEKLGMFFGMGNKGLKSYVEDLGMKIYSVHTNIYKDFEKKVEETAEIGIKYFIYNWEGPGKTLDDYKRMADDFNVKGEYCKQHDIKFTFHNHDFTFYKMGDTIPQDWIMQHTDADLVDFQIDFYWVLYAGQDPVEWINRYPGRFKLCHFKDRSKDSKEREGKGIVELGTGTIDFRSILNKIKNSTIKYYLVDQDTCNDRTDPLACAKTDADYLKNIRF